jgi:ADP-heptose:LPS heptosyltransferase
VNTLPGTAPEQADSEAMILRRYRQRYRKQDAVVAGFDFILGMLLRRPTQHPPPPPRRILLANAGHLGDAVMSTALFPVIERAFPGASIGFLTGRHSRAIIEGHPSIERAHYLDHWFNSRSKQPRRSVAAEYYTRTMPAMVRELRAANYDVAIDLHGWMPNFVPLLWRADIPVRVGFSRVGFAPLLTHALRYTYDRRHEIDHYLDLLCPWSLPAQTLALARPILAPVTADCRKQVQRMLGLDGAYQVLHPASSTPTRDWSLDGWSSLAARIVDGGATPVITGAGPRDQAMADRICLGVPRAVNAVNRLTWPELMALLSDADCVYSVETSIGHAAAALGRRVVAIFGGMADPRHWSPRGSAVVTAPVPCSPCFNKRGCAHRSCLVLSTLEDVEAARDEAARDGLGQMEVSA